jgi:micrococcal nuclease
MKPIKYLVPVVALLLSSQVAIGQTEQPPPESAKIYAVIDGDTVRATLNNKKVTLRLIGIDAPEVKPPQCYSRQSAQALRKLVLNKTVVLEADEVDKDQFGRLLRYAYLDDGRMVNEEMIKGGFATTLLIDNDKYIDLLTVAQEDAQAASAGMWGACAAPAPAVAAPAVAAPAVAAPPPEAPAPAPQPLVQQSGNCDPSYPEICIPANSPDLDCPDISYRRFKVVPPDPHRFDGDKDGIGCESG